LVQTLSLDGFRLCLAPSSGDTKQQALEEVNMNHRWIALGACALCVGHAARAADSAPPVNKAALEFIGKGVQIYACAAIADGFGWRLKAPEADLLDAKGVLFGKHFAGPSWQAKDGSTVVGESMNATPSPRADAIPWLVLRAKSHSGPGVMEDVAFIVRTATRGGLAPKAGCDAAHVNAELRVRYSATYLFFRG
jgi:hypothetical protein